MLSSDYYVKVNIAARKFSGPEYRYQTVKELIDDHDRSAHNIVESSRILYDAARLMGMIDQKPNRAWKFLDLKATRLTSLDTGVGNEKTGSLAEDTRRKIKAFADQYLFADFKTFAAYWSGLTFTSTEEYLQAFYRYIPYVKLGIDDEEEMEPLCTTSASDCEPLKLGFARQRVVLRRVNDVFLEPAPVDLPDIIRESLLGFALRIEDEAIPLKTGAGCAPERIPSS
jgi:hypothetical protein